MSHVAVVTDSTAGLIPEQARALGCLGVEIVPLHVLVDDEVFTEGVDIDTRGVLEALRHRRTVSTSRPTPTAMLAAYEQLADQGASHIVSAHLSAQLSGTCDAAVLAARDAPVPVHVVDSRSAGASLGYAVATGARLARAGATAKQITDAIERRCAQSTVLLYVHSLEQLRRGGRIGAAAGLLGGALAIKPLLALVDGHIEPVERLRTTSRAMARLTELAGHAVTVAGPQVDVAIHHAGARERADQVAAALDEILADEWARAWPDTAADDAFAHPPIPGEDVVANPGVPGRPRVQVLDLPAVLAVHLGPGTLAAVVSPRP